MKSTWFGDRRRYEFAKLVADVSYCDHLSRVIESFLACSFWSFRQAVHQLETGRASEEFEANVLREQERFPNWRGFSAALGVLTLALEAEPYDFLGTVISELEQNDSKWKGQCFTPSPLCRVVAEMTVGDATPNDDRSILISEPACGGGAMVIATAEVLKSRGFYPWHYHVRAVDVDWRCVAICYVQATLLGIPATVVHGNTLSLEEWDTATTFAGVLHPPRGYRERSRQAFE